MRRFISLGTAAALVAATATMTAHAAAPNSAPTAAAPAAAKARAAQAAVDLVAHRPAGLHASAYDKFVKHAVISSKQGLQYVPYDRTYRGLPVAGGDFVVVTNSSGKVLATSVAQTSTISVKSTTPKLTRAAAESVARGRLSTVTKVEGTRLAVSAFGTSRLAWETTVAGTKHGEASRLTVLVDALTGRVLHTQEHVADVTGTGNGWTNGTVSLETTQSGSTFTMVDPAHPTVKCQDAATNTTFSGTDNVWGNSNGTVRETGCADSLYDAEREEAMLSSWLGRNGFNGSGGGWPIRVGLNDQNAYYDGTQIQIGKNTVGQWIGSLDVVAHEHGHGIDDHTPGGISRAGTQEFVADTFGAATEAYANNASDPADYTVGEEVNLVGNGPIRYMYNPSLAGDKNCYDSSVPNGEVHAAAGPGNHWFYLLAEGTNPTNGQPTSPTCNSTSITGVGIQNAIKIMYNAMLMKTSTSSYLKYRTWTLTAAKNMDSTCALFNTTKAAWNAVSVPAQTADPTCGGTTTVTVSNPGNRTGTVGTAITPITFTATPSGTYSWSASGLPAGLTISSSTGTISGTPTAGGTYGVTVTATGSNGTGSTSFTITVSGGGGGCSSPGQKLGNPGFESGTTPWTGTTGSIGNWSAYGEPAHSGTRSAYLDGYGSTHTEAISQSVSIPAGCSTYTLGFFLHIDSSETTTSVAYDKLTVKLGSTTLATYSNLNKASGYSQKSFNVSGFAGQTVTLNFTGTEDSSLQTSFVIDDTSLNVS